MKGPQGASLESNGTVARKIAKSAFQFSLAGGCTQGNHRAGPELPFRTPGKSHSKSSARRLLLKKCIQTQTGPSTDRVPPKFHQETMTTVFNSGRGRKSRVSGSAKRKKGKKLGHGLQKQRKVQKRKIRKKPQNYRTMEVMGFTCGAIMPLGPECAFKVPG